MKVYRLIKMIVLIAAGVCLFVFGKTLMNNEGAILNGVVGTVIAFYGIEGILIPLITKRVKQEKLKIASGIVNVLLAIIMIFFLEGKDFELRVMCALWSLWSITRETEEIFEKSIDHFKKHPITSLLDLAESVVVILFSVLLIIAKDQETLLEHAYAHVILLGIELIIEVLWEYVGEYEAKLLERAKRRRKYAEQKQDQETDSN